MRQQNLKLVFLAFVLIHQIHGQIPKLQLIKEIFAGDRYNTRVRPVLDQSEPLMITVNFDISSIIVVDDVNQKFVCRGMFTFRWSDQLISWNPADYENIEDVNLNTDKIWTPRVILANSLDQKNDLDADNGQLSSDYTGNVTMTVTRTFTVSCDLYIFEYPYDHQSCQILILTRVRYDEGILFDRDTTAVSKNNYSEHDEWDLTSLLMHTYKDDYTGYMEYSCVNVTLHIKRRPTILLFNKILPVVILSFMNLMIFIIPVESGKLGYGITLLLVIFLYLDNISTMLPSSSRRIPLISAYIGLLLIICVMSIVVSIIISRLKFLRKGKCLGGNLGESSEKVTYLLTPVDAISHREMKLGKNRKWNFSRESAKPTHNYKVTGCNQEISRYTKPIKNKLQVIWKNIDMICFCLFLCAWLSVTLGFMLRLSL